MTRVAAWTVPVVVTAVSVPAYAASPCEATAGAVDWANTSRYIRAGATSATYTIPDPDGAGPGQELVLTITNTFLGSGTQLGDQLSNINSNWGSNDNLRTTTGVGGSGNGTASLQLHQSPSSNAGKVSTWSSTSNKSVTTFSFSRPVTNLTFTIRDIDSAQNDFWDGIALAGAAFTSSKANSGYVTGTGALTDPFRSSGNNLGVGDGSTDGNVAIAMASVSSFEFHYWNLSDSSAFLVDGDQKVFLSGLSFDHRPC